MDYREQDFLISVFMPVFNTDRYLADAIESILDQTYRNFEFIIIDDGSSDGCREISQKYAASDSRIRFIHRENRGLSVTRNQGLELALGKYLVLMDSDDISASDRIERQLDFMEKNPGCVVCGSAMQLIGEGQGVVAYDDSAKANEFELIFSPTVGNPCSIIRMDPVRKHRLTYEDGSAPAEDYGFWIKLVAHGEIRNLPEVLLHYRIHSTQSSQVHRQVQQHWHMKYMQAGFNHLFGELMKKDDLALHWSFFKLEILGQEELQKVSHWAEALVQLCRGMEPDLARVGEAAVTNRFREQFRKSARIGGLALWPVYWAYRYRPRLDLGESKFLLLLFLSWLKQSLFPHR